MKFQVAEALEQSRSGQPVIPYLDFSSPNIEDELEANYDIATTKTNNGILIQLLLLGQYLRRSQTAPNLNLRNHRIGIFLFEVFQYEPEAVAYLSDVSVTSIDRVSVKDQNIIIQSLPRRPIPAPSPSSEYDPDPRPSPKRTRFEASPSPSYNVLGQNIITPGEMWQDALNTSDSPRYSPKPIETTPRSPSPVGWYDPPFSPSSSDETIASTSTKPRFVPRSANRDPRLSLKRSREVYDS